MNYRASGIWAALVVGVGLLWLPPAHAAVVRGPADVGRIKPEERLPRLDRSRDTRVVIPKLAPSAPVPPQAKTIHLTLKQVTFQGVTVFTPEELKGTYAAYLGKDITLDKVYEIAAAVTKYYRDADYFLSLAYVPNQRIGGGNVTIQVVEGYVAKVDLPKEVAGYPIMDAYVEALTAQRPLQSKTLESFLLRVNDLPGFSYRAVLAPLDKTDEGKVMLSLVAADKSSQFSVSVDNNSSRFLGPNEALFTYSADLLPMQHTVVSALSSLPSDKLRYGMVDHSIAIAPKLTLGFNAGITDASPGYTLEPLEVESSAISFNTSLTYAWIRQRQENLSLKATLDSRNVSSDIAGAPLTRDRIRALRLGINYDMVDSWAGYDAINLVFSQGIEALGGTKKNSLNQSRAGAEPDFYKLEFNLSRLQPIDEDWLLQAAVAGLYSPNPLYSSEEFGYGGQSFGRAYDSSDITGNKGINGSIELRYSGFSGTDSFSIQPFGFYDIGKVWSSVIGQVPEQSGSSAGLGLRFSTAGHQSGLIGLAWPLTRDISTPIYGTGTKGPRILLQINQNF